MTYYYSSDTKNPELYYYNATLSPSHREEIHFFTLSSILFNYLYFGLKIFWAFSRNVLYQISSWYLTTRDSGNDFRFPDFASHTGCFRLIFFVSPLSYLFGSIYAAWIYEIRPSKNETEKRPKSFPLSLLTTFSNEVILRPAKSKPFCPNLRVLHFFAFHNSINFTFTCLSNTE